MAEAGEPAGQVESHLAVFQLPVPVAFYRSRRVHPGRRWQEKQVLEWYDDRFGPAAVDVCDEGRRHFASRGVIGKVQHEAQALLLFFWQRFVPAPGGVIVMGPRISYGARFRIKGEAAVRPFFQMEWQDPHPRQGKAAAQLAHVVGDDAQILGDEPHRSQCLIDPAQDVFSRCRFPLPFFAPAGMDQ